MSVESLGSAPQTALGGAGRSLDVTEAYPAISATLAPGGGASLVQGTNAMQRFMGRVFTPLQGLGGFDIFGFGSPGAAATHGQSFFDGIACNRMRDAGPQITQLPFDWFCGVCAQPRLVQPLYDGIVDPFAIWEVGAEIGIDAPAVAITRDCGMLFTMAPVTGWAANLRSGNTAGNDAAGFGAMFNGSNGELLWVCKQASAHPAALTEQISLGIFTPGRLLDLRFRFYSATRAAAARVAVRVNGVELLSRRWDGSTVLPTPATVTSQPVLGYLRPFIRASQESAANAQLYWRNFHIYAAPTEALLS